MNGISAAFTGRVGSDPEQKYTQAGKPLLNFSVCVDADSTTTEDRAAPEPLWVRATVWGEAAEHLAAQIKKGGSVYLEGRLRHDKWVGRDGDPRCGLSLSAWRCDVHGQLGRSAPKREREAAAAW
jgi:single-strand DNA-binding protein